MGQHIGSIFKGINNLK